MRGWRCRVLVAVLFSIFSGVAFGNSWQELPGPTVKLVARIEPSVTLTISSDYYENGTPVVRFLCDKGPGIYEGNPITVTLTANVQVKLYCSATDLTGDSGTIPATQLSVRFDDPERPNEPFKSFKHREDKGVMVYNSPKPVSFTTRCYFRIEIDPQDRAGEYSGQAFFTVLYKL